MNEKGRVPGQSKLRVGQRRVRSILRGRSIAEAGRALLLQLLAVRLLVSVLLFLFPLMETRLLIGVLLSVVPSSVQGSVVQR